MCTHLLRHLMNGLTAFRWMGILLCAAAFTRVSGQAVPTPQALPVTAQSPAPTFSLNQATLQTFQAQQQALAPSFNALLTLNPTPQQLQAWQQQNATALAAQQQLALDMGAESALEPMPLMT
jgi:hypothetical protein